MLNEPAPLPVAEGTVIAGKYLVGQVLGRGGMGVVVAGTHLQLDQPIALKFLLPEVLGNPEIVARFTREARAAARIHSEHVVRVLDVGALESGAPYMVMERLEGEDLAGTLQRRGRLPIAEAVDYLLQACEAVAEAHVLGMVHRDLKPANLFLAKRPNGKPLVKVLDFGISKIPASMETVRLTGTFSFMGSPPYMSPEQLAASGSVDPRSDIWSLGIVLYELLTHRTVFGGDSSAMVVASVLSQAPTSPRRHREDLPAELDAAIMRCLKKSPDQRFSDVAELASAVGPFGSRSSAELVERISRTLHPRVATQVLTMATDGDAASGYEATRRDETREAEPQGDAEAQHEAESREEGSRVSQKASSASSRASRSPRSAHASRSAGSQKRPPTSAPPSRAPSKLEGAGATPQRSRTFIFVVALVVVAVATAIGLGAARLGKGRTPPPPEPSPGLATTPTPPSVKPPAPEPIPEIVVPTVLSGPRPEPAQDPEPAPPPRVKGKGRGLAETPSPKKQPTETHGAVGRDPAARPPAGRSFTPAAGCARLLERQSLGETLSADETAFYARKCRR